MDKRTAEIIMLCKGNHKYPGNYSSLCDLLAAYMSDTCLCDKSVYTESVLQGIILTAFKDYLDSCDKPSFFIYQLEDVWNIYNNPLMDPKYRINNNEAVLRAFSTVQVRDDGKYVNGFTEENTRDVVPTK